MATQKKDALAEQYQYGKEELHENQKEKEKEKGGEGDHSNPQQQEIEDESESESSQSAGEKEEFILVKLEDIRKEVQCPICLGIIRKTRTVMECLHRFCRDCIDKSMRLGNNECPACRTHCASRRSLRDDPNYDALIFALYPNVDKYEEEELCFNEEERICNKKIQEDIAETFRRQTELLSNTKTNGRSTPGTLPIRRSRKRGRPRTHNVGPTDLEGESWEQISRDENSPNKTNNKKRGRRKQSNNNDDDDDDDHDDDDNTDHTTDDEEKERGNFIITRENLTASPLGSWGKNGARSQLARHASKSGGEGHSRNCSRAGRLTAKLADHLKNSEGNDSQLDVHVTLSPLDGKNIPNLETPYLCCRPSLSVTHLCQFVARQTSWQPEMIEIFAKKPEICKVLQKSPLGFSELNALHSLERDRSLAELQSSFSLGQQNLELMYSLKVQQQQ